MPQLDPSGFSSQLFWLTLSFVSLYILLAKILLPRIGSILEVRADTIKSSIEEAEKLKSEAERTRDAYEKSLADTRKKARAIIAESQSGIAASFAARETEIALKMDKKLAESEAGILQAKKEVMQHISTVAGDVSTLIVEIVAGYRPDAGAVVSYVNQAVSNHTGGM